MPDAPSSDPLVASTEVRRRHIVAKAIAVGVMAGAVGAAFRLGLDSAERWRESTVQGLGPAAGLAIAVLVGVTGGAVAVTLVRQFAPHAAGSGIPQVKSVVSGTRPPEWRRMLPVKFFSGLCGIGGGLALGREGPTIQLGSGVGAWFTEVFRVRAGEGERRALISAGAAAGLAAAFNAPLSGLVFVLEELHGAFTPVLFVAAFLASVSGDVVARLLCGSTPVYRITDVAAPGLNALPWAAVLGALIGGLGVLFNRSLLAGVALGQRIPRRLPWLGGAAAGVVVAVAGWTYPGLAGSGGSLVHAALSGHVLVRVLPLLLVARFALTIVSYGSGAAGGIFAPLLVLGGLTGLWFGSGVQALTHTTTLTAGIFCVLGMGAMFTAVVRAPLTGIVLMIELTGIYDFMLPLLVSCLAAYGVAEGLGNVPIYEALRDRAAPSTPAPAAEPRSPSSNGPAAR